MTPTLPLDEQYISSIHGFISVTGEDWHERDTCGVCSLEIVYLLQDSVAPLQRAILQAEVPGRAVTVPPRTRRACLGQTQGSPGSQHQEFNLHTQSPNQDI